MTWGKPTPERPWGQSEKEKGSSAWRNIIRAIIEVVPGGVIRAGKTSYSDDTNAGWWLGIDDDGLAKFNIGNATWWFHWSGTTIELRGDISWQTPTSYAESAALKWRSAAAVILAQLTDYITAGWNQIILGVYGRDDYHALLNLNATSDPAHNSQVTISAESDGAGLGQIDVQGNADGTSVIDLTANVIRLNFHRHYFATAAPSTGTWSLADITWNTTPAPSAYVGWVCTTAGSPGTWKGFGLIET